MGNRLVVYETCGYSKTQALDSLSAWLEYNNYTLKVNDDEYFVIFYNKKYRVEFRTVEPANRQVVIARLEMGWV
jgi:hypothetical protein